MERLITAPGPDQTLDTKVSFEAYLEAPGEERFTEWVEGEIVVMSPASIRHQIVSSFLERLLGFYVERKELGVVLRAPVAMRLPGLERAREPDLLFVHNDHVDRLRETFLDGPADLAIEIISPESISRDRGEKFVEYEQAGIPEYWLIDPIREAAEFWVADETGHYRLASTDPSGWFTSHVVDGFRLRVAWLWSTPPLYGILRDLDLL